MERLMKDVIAENTIAEVSSHSLKSGTSLASTEDSDAKLSFVASRNSIDVKLINQEPVSALRFEIEFNSKFVFRPITLIPRIQNLNSNINFQDSSLKVVILDIDGKGIPIGAGTIASIPIKNQQEFQVTGAYASSRTAGTKQIPYSIVNDEDEDLISPQQNNLDSFGIGY
ncbi:MAG TPA: hypothetical protein VLX91_09570 [Candidatus Acidoferrales bacterium]|nr:hypothetical protein [Candidatus Acidoferrales bacterium]